MRIFNILDIIIRGLFIPSVLIFCISTFVKDEYLRKLIRGLLRRSKRRNKKTIRVGKVYAKSNSLENI